MPAKVVPIRPRIATPRIASTAPPEARIRQLLEDKDRALRAKDLEGVLALYDADLLFLDLKPSGGPAKSRVKGSRGLRRVWQACMPHLPADFHIETRDLVITVAGEIAVGHRLFRVPEVAQGQSGWIREITMLRFAAGEWRIVHEHCSVA